MAKDRAVLHRIFALAKKVEYRDGNPVADVDAPKSDGRTPLILSCDEYEKLLTACESRPMLACYVVTLAETGVRSKSEGLWLRWDDVRMEDGFLWIDTWLAMGENPVHVKEAMGPADLGTTMGYTHFAKEHLRALVEREPEREELRDLA